MTSSGGAGRDRSADVLRVGYPFLAGLRRGSGSPTVDFRLLGRRTTVLSGPDGARLFYDGTVMRRRGAIPLPLRRVLFGVGAVHGLDGDDHRHRKALFLQLLDPAAARAIAGLAAERWHRRDGEPVRPAELFDEAVDVHAFAALRWSGVWAADLYDQLHADLVAMVDGFGSVGRRYLRGYRARRRAERWARDLVHRVRAGGTDRSGTPLAAIAEYRGHDGKRLPDRVAGVELLNVVRPTVAVAYFVAFAADALAGQPELRDRLAEAGDAELESFAHELRRYYPFVPMLAARARRSVRFGGSRLRRGRRVLLDVYGTLHDPDTWERADEFRADRFRGADPDPFAFVPQGGGDPAAGHRCPGERVAVELIKAAVRHLVGDRPPVADRPPYRLDRMPSRPGA